jgi:hypothetical protein
LSDLEKWGPAAGFGGPWNTDALTANQPSEPFLVNGFTRRALHLKQSGGSALDVQLQYDPAGDGAWLSHTNLTIPADGYTWYSLPASLNAIWVRLVPASNAPNVTAYFHLGNSLRSADETLFAGLAPAASTNAFTDGIIRPREGDARTLQFAANRYGANGSLLEQAYYEIDGSFQLTPVPDVVAESTLRSNYGLSSADFTVDNASVIYTEGGNRFRLPKNAAAYDTASPSGWPRGVREIITERNMFQAHGTFYELPRSESGGFRRIRPITTHNRRISDFATWRGLLVLAGVANNAVTNGHVFRSTDNKTALWFGEADDLWRMGAPRGHGGPWKNSAVINGVPSDPYLMFGYEHKELSISHSNASPVTFTVEVDFAVDNTWSEYARFTVPAGQTVTHVFPDGYSAHWVRLKSDTTTTATAAFAYGPTVTVPVITNISASAGQVTITFAGGPAEVPGDFQLLGSTVLPGTFTDTGATITGGAGIFQVTTPINTDAFFFRIKRP